MNKAALRSTRQASPAAELIRCVVIESGSLRLTDSDAENFDQTIVIAQMQDEEPEAFAERTLERIASVERSGRRFAAATLLAGSQHEEAAQAARRRIVLGLTAHALATPGFGSLTLRAARQTPPEHRAELLDLAADVMAFRGDAPSGVQLEPVSVRLRFDEGVPESPHRSGAFHAMPDKPVA